MADDWFENEELFLRQLAIGHQQARYAAGVLRERGIPVQVTPMEVRDTVDDRHRFSDEYDLLVGEGRTAIVDVKSRDLSFTAPDDYPYATAFVDTVAGWDAKTHKPVAILLVSQVTGTILAV